MRYFNLHRHSSAKDLEETAIINIFPGQEIPDGEPYSVGIHPWHVNGDTMVRDLNLLRGKVLNAAAIGECGLDKCCETPFELQTKVFRYQVEMASEFAKALIIHCVRAYQEIIAEKKSRRSSLPWIIHGFRGNSQTASQLLDHGFHLSFGESLLRDSRLSEILASVPEKRFFLETDESSIPICDLYEKTASVRGMKLMELMRSQDDNSRTLFGNGFL